MVSRLLLCALGVALGAMPLLASEPERKPNPFAPSLPLLTDEEEDQLDKVIDRFIQYDTGKLRGEEGKQALAEFLRLRPEAIPALIRGLNRAALIDHSCPAVTIAKKLAVMLNGSNDAALLEFARENIGAGVTHSRHMGVIKDLRVTCMLRRRVVLQNTAVVSTPRKAPPQPALRSMSTSQLLLEGSKPAAGPRRDQIVRELERRPRDQVVSDLGAAAADPSNQKGQQAARDILETYLSRQGDKLLREKLKDESVEVRAAAARVAGTKRLPFGDELIALLADENLDVRGAAHAALVRLNRGTDLGPEPDADAEARAAAVKKWRTWWEKRQAAKTAQ